MTVKKGDPSPNPEGKGGTTTNMEMGERLDFTAELLSSPLTYGDVVQALCTEFQIKERMAKRYVERVFTRWQVERLAEREHEKERQIRRILKRIAKHDGASVKANPSIAHRSEVLLARILGTMAPVKVINIDDVDVGALSDEQLRRIAGGEDPAIVLGTASTAIH